MHVLFEILTWLRTRAARTGCSLGDGGQRGGLPAGQGPIPQYLSERGKLTDGCQVQLRVQLIRQVRGDEAGSSSGHEVSPADRQGPR